MRSLLIRIFVAFWSIILITIIVAGALGYSYAERARAAVENFGVSEAMLEASSALQQDGREGLTQWLVALPDSTAVSIYVLDERGRDLLGRRVPPPVEKAIRRFSAQQSRRGVRPRATGNLRPARPFTQLIGPDDRAYTLFVLPPQGIVGRWLSERGVIVIGLLALFVSASVSYVLARAISRPIRRLRASAVAISEGDLETRVADQLGRRRDEIGLLADDFDRMASGLQRAWNQQTELTRNVSHELRSPLARLSVALELARRKAGELAEFDRIETETGRLDDLIGQLLQYSRLDASQHDDPEPVRVDEVLQSVLEDVRYENARAGNDIHFEPSQNGTARIHGYPTALRSALENVIRNAMQHAAGGQVTVQLRVEPSQVVISVEDEGGGIVPSELDKIFEPFYRSGKQKGDPDSGSGLGLAITKRAIELHGGTVSASNQPNGLRIEVCLPRAE